MRLLINVDWNGLKIALPMRDKLHHSVTDIEKKILALRYHIDRMDGPDSQLSVPDWPHALPYSRLKGRARDELFAHPPRVLVSAALLLQKIGVVSHVEPDRVSNTKNGVSAYWFLRIMRNDSVRCFHENIMLISPRKEAQLSANVQSIKWSWRKNKNQFQESFLT